MALSPPLAAGVALLTSLGLCLAPLQAGVAAPLQAVEQPLAIYHAFHQPYRQLGSQVCGLARQGYSHVQISPAQLSSRGSEWWRRYQPIDHSRLEGLGTAEELRQLIDRAHGCRIKVIADVVFNHMADLDGRPDQEDLRAFPGLSSADFNALSRPGDPLIRRPCEPDYANNERRSEVECWLGTLPDLNFSANVRARHKAHLRALLALGIDGFRFDAAKHMPPAVVKEYIDYVNAQSAGRSWNYLEVIEDHDTRAEEYNRIAAVSDFRLYRSLRRAFRYGGDLRSLPPEALNDSRSVVFGQNHDTIRALNPQHALDPYDDEGDAYLATAYVLAREAGTPLVLDRDHRRAAYIPYGVTFRRIMAARGREGRNVRETVLRVIDSPLVLVMERGAEGFFVVNKGSGRWDQPVLDLTLTQLDGCYRELRNGFTVAIEKRQGRKFVTRWGRWSRGGIELQGRDALYFIREPFDQCSAP